MPCACLLFVSAACSYDWTVPPPSPALGGMGGADVTTSTTTTSAGGDGGSQGGAGAGGAGGAGGIGGEDVCAASPADSACETCVKGGCCPELTACVNDVQCNCYRLCYAAPTAGCFLACGLTVTPGSPTDDLVTCAQANSCAACLP